MRQLTVLAVSPCDHGLLSAQLVFTGGCAQLSCGRTVSEAASFLARHPGTLVICDPSAGGIGWDESVSYLLAAGAPSALVLFTRPQDSLIGVEVRPLGGIQSAQALLEDPHVVKIIYLAWQYCKSTRAQFITGGHRAARSVLN